jgi:hypothetical protein
MQRTRGVSLAKGPIALIGLLGIIYGLSALILRAHGFALHFPNGDVHGSFWLHVEVNGWTALLFIAAGLALVFSAAAHITAKTMAVLVGVVLIVLAIIAIIQGHGALGIFAAGHWTEIVWGAAGVVLLLLALLPRVGGRTVASGPATTPAAGPARPVGYERAPTTDETGTATNQRGPTTDETGTATNQRAPLTDDTGTAPNQRAPLTDEPRTVDPTTPRPLTADDEPLVQRTQTTRDGGAREDA